MESLRIFELFSLVLKFSTSSFGKGLVAHPLGFLLNIWNALQSISKALIIAFEIPPEIDTCKPNLISAFVTSLLTQIGHFRYKNYSSINQPESWYMQNKIMIASKHCFHNPSDNRWYDGLQLQKWVNNISEIWYHTFSSTLPLHTMDFVYWKPFMVYPRCY